MTSTEQRIQKMLGKLEAQSPEEHEASVALAEAQLTYQQVAVEQARLKAVATNTRSKDDVARLVEYTENTVKPAAAAVLSAIRDLMKVKSASDFDNASLALAELREDLGEGFDELREEMRALVDDLSERITRKGRAISSTVVAGVTTTRNRLARVLATEPAVGTSK